jgi:hypothetical protein
LKTNRKAVATTGIFIFHINQPTRDSRLLKNCGRKKIQ